MLVFYINGNIKLYIVTWLRLGFCKFFCLCNCQMLKVCVIVARFVGKLLHIASFLCC